MSERGILQRNVSCFDSMDKVVGMWKFTGPLYIERVHNIVGMVMKIKSKQVYWISYRIFDLMFSLGNV